MKTRIWKIPPIVEISPTWANEITLQIEGLLFFHMF